MFFSFVIVLVGSGIGLAVAVLVGRAVYASYRAKQGRGGAAQGEDAEKRAEPSDEKLAARDGASAEGNPDAKP